MSAASKACQNLGTKLVNLEDWEDPYLDQSTSQIYHFHYADCSHPEEVV
jgi:hypothetical protein